MSAVRFGGLTLGVLGLGATLVASSGCAGLAESGGNIDGGGLTSIDATGATNEHDAMTGLGPFADAGAAGIDAGRAHPEESESGLLCGNGLDDNGDGLTDCEQEDGCGATPLCCVGRTTDACCTSTTLENALDADALPRCDSGPVSACPDLLSLAAPFGGEPELRLDPGPDGVGGRSFAPVGRDAESGLALAASVDATRDVVRVVATIASPTSCAPGCIDGVAVSLGATLEAGLRPAPVVGVLVSAARGDVSLVVSGAIVARTALPDDAPHMYTLETRPSGEVRLSLDGAAEPVLTGMFEVPAISLHPMLHGYAENRPADAAPPPRVSSIAVRALGCDRPQALTRGAGTLVVGASPAWGDAPARAPSVAVSPAGARMAFEAGGAIWLASPRSDGFEVAPGAAPILAQGTAGGLTFADPSLVALDDHWTLLVTGVDGTGTRALYRVDGPAGWAEVFDVASLSRVFGVDRAPPRADGIESLDGPSAVSFEGRLLVAARARHADGGTSLVLLREGDTPGATYDVLTNVCGTGCDLGAADPDGRLHATSSDPFAFDHDEVAAPSISIDAERVVRVHFAGRRGTRWSIGLLVAAAPVADAPWVVRRARGAEIVLRPSGAGADALGVADPDVVALGGVPRLFYTGLDGITTRVLAARGR